MKRHLLFALGVACILAMPVVALVYPSITFDLPTVASVPGPWTHWEARVRTLDDPIGLRVISTAPEPAVEIPLLPPEPFWIDVRACGDEGCSAWSMYIPETADCNHDGGVGIADLFCIGGIGDFTQLLQSWGKRTVWDETLQVRRYEVY